MKIIPEHFWEILFYDEWKSELENQLFSKVGKDNVEQYFIANIERHFSLFQEQFRKQVEEDVKKAFDRKLNGVVVATPKADNNREERLKRAEEILQKYEGTFASIESGQNDILSAYRSAEKKIDVISDNYSKIHQKYQAQTELIRRQTELIDRQQQDINELHKLIADLKCQLDEIKTPAPAAETKSESAAVSVPSPENRSDTQEHYIIDDFTIQKTQQVFLPTDISILNSHLDMAEDCEELTEVLKKSEIDNRDLLIKVVEKYRNELGKLRKKLKFTDDDYISMEATEKFADIVERHLVSVLCPAIYEGMKLDAGIYKNVLSALNRYLQKCCFYTGEVNPAVSLSKQQDLLEAMRIIPKDTENPEEDNKIVEVRMLPYFLNFTDEDGNPEKHCIEGQMVVQKLKA